MGRALRSPHPATWIRRDALAVADYSLSAGLLDGAQVVTAAAVVAATVVAAIVAVVAVVGEDVAEVAEYASKAEAATWRLPKRVVDRSSWIRIGEMLLLADDPDIGVSAGSGSGNVCHPAAGVDLLH